MPVYNNEEELKRRKPAKSTASKAGRYARLGAKVSPAPVGSVTAGLGEAVRFGKEGFSEAAKRPTAMGRAARGLRTAVTLPVAAAYGAAKEPIRMAKGVASGAKEFATEFLGGEAGQKSSPVGVSRGAVPVTAAPPAAPPAVSPPSAPARIAPAAKATSPINVLKSRAGEDSGIPGTGYITSRTGAVGIGADGKVIMKGKPLPSSKAPARAPARRKSRMTTYGGYRLPERERAERDPSLRRVSDIAAPKTIGEVPGHRREVEAARFDIAAEQKERDRAQRQSQFGAGQEQQQEQFEAGQEQQQGQFSARQGLDERRVAGTEQQQQLAAAQQKAKLAADQRREERGIAKEAEISAARAKFEAADTAAEKVAAAQMLNSLQGMKIDTRTKERSPGLTQKETSQQVQGALKAFEGAGGEAAAGTDFYTWMRQNDTRGYQAAFGNLTPKDIRDHARIQELTDEQIMSSDLSEGMRPGETPAQFRQRLDVEYRSKRGY